MLRRLLFSVMWMFIFASCTGVIMGLLAGALDVLSSMGVVRMSRDDFVALGSITGNASVFLGCGGLLLGLLQKLPGTRPPARSDIGGEH
jgi:hypothetical protein